MNDYIIFKSCIRENNNILYHRSKICTAIKNEIHCKQTNIISITGVKNIDIRCVYTYIILCKYYIM